jgi:Raf kinase inhibitor-like YbhB/YbcL family protein
MTGDARRPLLDKCRVLKQRSSELTFSVGIAAVLLVLKVVCSWRKACRATPLNQKDGAAMSLDLTSTAFMNGSEIPVMYTCDGKDISPPLAWSGASPNAKSLALIVDDPDAPDPAAPQRTWVHWVLYNIPPADSGLKQGDASGALPAGTKEGVNDWKRPDYGGPCPPVGRHRYFFKLYALDVVLPDLNKPDKQKLEKAMNGHILEKKELLGTYQR